MAGRLPSPPLAANRRIVVARRADGIPDPDIFATVEAPMPTLPPGGLIVRVLYATVDPAMRGWVSMEENYASVATGAVMRATAVGEVVASDHPNWAPGDPVCGWFGWQQYCAAMPADLLWPIDPALAPLPAWLGVLGLNGITAWIGLCHLAQAKAGDTVLVSTAAGGVGSVVGQLAAARGLTAIGLTGSAEKAAAGASMGYTHMLDYAAVPDLAGAIAAAAPQGIDIFFDNTGGWIADAAFPALATGARVIQCGTAAVSSWTPVPDGPRRERTLLVRRISWRGFVVTDHVDLYPAALAELAALYRGGRLAGRDHILDGLDAAPGAIAMLYRGENQGRLLIAVGRSEEKPS